MRWSFKIGGVSGIDIRIHFTFVFILIWAVMQGSSGRGGIRSVLFAVLSTLLLFACVTLHELGHGLAAKRFGIRVRDITLLPIGGVARLESLPEKPLQELIIATAGPAINFSLAIALGLVLVAAGGAGLMLGPAYGLRLMHMPASPVSLLVYLLAANLLLGLFNLIPAFPMDGGRVLRALLALWTSYPRATRIAARVGQVLAVGLVLLAMTPVGNLSLVLIALFVFTGASLEDQAVQARAMLGGLRVRHALPTRVLRAVGPEAALVSVLELSIRTQQRDFPVVRDGTLVGILTRDDLLAEIRRAGEYARVEDAMQREFHKVSPDDPLLQAQQLIAQTGLGALPVFDRGHLVGLISLEDINRAYANLSWRRR